MASILHLLLIISLPLLISLVRPILVAKQPFKFSRNGLGLTFSFGFICSGSCDSFVLAIAIMVKTNDQSTALQVVWSANRDKLVKENATLELKKDGNFVLTDINGTIVWSTITSGKPVSGINLTDNGSLVLFDSENNIIWNSFDFPVDTLLPGQRLVAWQRLVSRASTYNWTHSGSHFILLSPSGFSSFIESDGIPQVYYRKGSVTINSEDEEAYLQFMNGNVSLVFVFKRIN
ncbi:EP1-like glycoprotein 2 [Dioscorea cayenensis subsp. rotundata]|uniref:EP1-like glycoprotein 2 n=1 Tax=Dioscorea cayennensis subsp. rotundata TaxID=55577 RepID=A0AB40CV79_DIOCR|nr:EP1-like glycoprotein 2 [Dioscorea cayenensis subsp. rotundata]